MAERIVLSDTDIARVLTRISHEIMENNRGEGRIILLGIPSRGVFLARRLADKINEIEAGSALAGSLDVTMYRDDLDQNPLRVPAETHIPSSLDGSTVILVDDVLYSGRTIRAALDAISDIGRPLKIKLAVLIDRGHRELPIRADFVGKNLPTSRQERVFVHLSERDDEDKVSLEQSK
ncbi:MAG: bifunctional pyr operon transcriptional regulator/uracil phosphoribosyltransferase PyrR [Microbacteriaceae bacterium]